MAAAVQGRLERGVPAEQGFFPAPKRYEPSGEVWSCHQHGAFVSYGSLQASGVTTTSAQVLLWSPQAFSVFQGRKLVIAWFSQVQIPFAHWREVVTSAEPLIAPANSKEDSWMMEICLFTPPLWRWPLIKLSFTKLWMMNKWTQATTSNKEAVLKLRASGAMALGPHQPLEGEKGCSGPSTPAPRSSGRSRPCSLKVQVKLDLQPHLGRRASAGRAERDPDKEWWEAEAGGSGFP